MIRIGVTGPRDSGHAAWYATRLALARTGARAVRLMPPVDPAAVEGLDGLILGGGAHVHPSLYGQEIEVEGGRYDRARDRLEIAALQVARESKVPVLAICRGMQLVNIAYGGSLDQNAWAEIEGNTRDTVFARRAAMVFPGTRLGSIIGATWIRVNRLHRQAIDVVGEGLQVSARGLGGTVQAVEPEGTDGGFLLGVQWHPEYLIRHRRQLQIFRALVRAARERQASASTS